MKVFNSFLWTQVQHGRHLAICSTLEDKCAKMLARQTLRTDVATTYHC